MDYKRLLRQTVNNFAVDERIKDIDMQPNNIKRLKKGLERRFNRFRLY